MRIVVPHTAIHPLANAALQRLAPEAERVDVSASTEAYYRLVAELWHAGDDFLLIEHDIELTEAALAQALDCPCIWSTSPYRGPGTSYEGATVLTGSLGCTRFRAELIAAVPGALAEVGNVDDGGPAVPLRDWRRLDARLLGVLMAHGYAPHVHAEVIHHHPYPYGCACGREHAAGGGR